MSASDLRVPQYDDGMSEYSHIDDGRCMGSRWCDLCDRCSKADGWIYWSKHMAHDYHKKRRYIHLYAIDVLINNPSTLEGLFYTSSSGASMSPPRRSGSILGTTNLSRIYIRLFSWVLYFGGMSVYALRIDASITSRSSSYVVMRVREVVVPEPYLVIWITSASSARYQR